MLQAIGLTSAPRRDLTPAVDDLTFEAPPGSVTALLGAPGAGKTTALRLMLALEPGRGVTYFRGRPLHRIGHPAREIGVLLGDVPGHPARTARGQLRMVCAAAGVPASRADELLDVVGLGALRDERLGSLSLGMDRRLGLASALLGDPHTLLLDAPSAGLSPRENSWLHGLLRAHAGHGGTVLYTTSDPKEAARTADRVVTVDGGRLVADQDAASFARTRLRPRVAVTTPHAARLADALNREARAGRRSVEVVAEEGAGSLLTVYGSSCPEVGETAFRHGVLVHRLADEIGDTGPVAAPSAMPAPAAAGAPAVPRPVGGGTVSLPPLSARPVRSPLRPVRYELRRMCGVRSAPLIAAAVLVASVALAVPLARTGGTPLPGLLAAWPALLPLPPAALGAGLLGALSFGDEYRYPALAGARGTVPRRLGLLVAKLAVTGVAALLLAALSVVADAGALRLVYGAAAVPVPGNWPVLSAGWAGLAVGCAWAGLLGAGIFRVTIAGMAAVVAVPTLVGPLVQKALTGPSVRSVVGLPGRLRELAWPAWPHRIDHWLTAAAGLVAQPVAAALALSLSVLLCAYLLTGLRRRARW
ncbi:ATP-binding cassette domain-containing protein [Streptomyces paludis]|uniref:ATP-binding cassette domain-containing protein n=1 Tax=Streptomyces paludis TaxID=2282738 RepID=A0A345HVF9_9ACTN|nr:ATP-binding cassette domain-containing protein [Streptomyces paludis]AXG80683.1 ATP-binding cassette domain-containing protein [Streptomyces paludis]